MILYFFLFLVNVLGLPNGYYNTSGHDIIDQYGNVVQLWGFNWFGADLNPNGFPENHNRTNLYELIEQVDSKGFNTWRMPICAVAIHNWINNVNQTNKTESLQFFENLISNLSVKGHKLIFDLHSVEPGGYQDNLWFNRDHPPNYTIEALEFLADYFKDNDTVIGLNLKTEPHGACQNNHGFNNTNISEDFDTQGQPVYIRGDFDTILVSAKWDNSSDDNNWKYFVETAGNRIHLINPNLLILVQGIECYNGLTTWWGGNFIGVKRLSDSIKYSK